MTQLAISLIKNRLQDTYGSRPKTVRASLPRLLRRMRREKRAFLLNLASTLRQDQAMRNACVKPQFGNANVQGLTNLNSL